MPSWIRVWDTDAPPGGAAGSEDPAYVLCMAYVPYMAIGDAQNGPRRKGRMFVGRPEWQPSDVSSYESKRDAECRWPHRAAQAVGMDGSSGSGSFDWRWLFRRRRLRLRAFQALAGLGKQIDSGKAAGRQSARCR